VRLGILLVVLGALLATASPAAAVTCAPPYSYAGLANATGGHGVRATLTSVKTPTVQQGHIGAWVGVGGPGMGPNGEDAWLQVGLASFEDGVSRLYYEVATPGEAPRYVEVDPAVASDEPHEVAVLEVGGRPSTWRVWVDGAPVGDAVYLPGSSGAWQPMAIAESWNGGSKACNAFAYRFERVAIARHAGGRWARLRPGTRYEDPGYRLVAARTGFIAESA
jgi:hypothetical protein